MKSNEWLQVLTRPSVQEVEKYKMTSLYTLKKKKMRRRRKKKKTTMLEEERSSSQY